MLMKSGVRISLTVLKWLTLSTRAGLFHAGTGGNLDLLPQDAILPERCPRLHLEPIFRIHQSGWNATDGVGRAPLFCVRCEANEPMSHLDSKQRWVLGTGG